jgi:hypothetical protein
MSSQYSRLFVLTIFTCETCLTLSRVVSINLSLPPIAWGHKMKGISSSLYAFFQISGSPSPSPVSTCSDKSTHIYFVRARQKFHIKLIYTTLREKNVCIRNKICKDLTISNNTSNFQC